jgi:hypothetical protein
LITRSEAPEVLLLAKVKLLNVFVPLTVRVPGEVLVKETLKNVLLPPLKVGPAFDIFIWDVPKF